MGPFAGMSRRSRRGASLTTRAQTQHRTRTEAVSQRERWIALHGPRPVISILPDMVQELVFLRGRREGSAGLVLNARGRTGDGGWGHQAVEHEPERKNIIAIPIKYLSLVPSSSVAVDAVTALVVAEALVVACHPRNSTCAWQSCPFLSESNNHRSGQVMDQRGKRFRQHLPSFSRSRLDACSQEP